MCISWSKPLVLAFRLSQSHSVGKFSGLTCIQDNEAIEKVQKRSTKLIISVKHLPYIERLKQLKLPMLKSRCLRGDMIEVFKIVKNYYDLEAAVKLNFNTFSTTRAVSYTHLTLPTIYSV